VVDNAGTLLLEQAGELAALHREWARTYPAEPAGPVLALERRIGGAMLGTVRRTLRGLLDRPGPGGKPDLRESVARMGHLLDDWSRLRVVSLADDALAEYLELTGSFAVKERKAPAAPPPRAGQPAVPWLRVRDRGGAHPARDGRRGGLRASLRLRLARLLLRAHGLLPGGDDIDLGAARRGEVDLARPELHAIAHNYLRASIETLGTGRRSIVDEAGLAVAFLHAGWVLAAMRAARSGRGPVDRDGLARGLMDASDLTHADPGAAYGALLGPLSGGVEAFFLFADAWPYRAAAR
jgi:hypothetical protein